MTKILFLTIALISLILLSPYSFACSTDGLSGFLPKNDLRIPAFAAKMFGGLSEEQFFGVIEKIETEYAPIFKNKGLSLSVDKDWADAEVNAFASMGERKSDRVIMMTGGLARHTLMTEDAFALVLCHEVGHHIGGFPLIRTDWLTAEEGADYFATLKCARRIFLHDNNQKIVKSIKVPPVVQVACASAHKDLNDRAICIRTNAASQVLGQFFALIPQPSANPKFETPDRSVAARTNMSYGSDQCRLDTFFQGSLCEKSFNEDVSDSDELKGACHGKTGHTVGLRPLCWFRPKA